MITLEVSITMEMIAQEKMYHVNCRIILQNILALQAPQFQCYSAEVLSTNYSAFLIFAFIYIFPIEPSFRALGNI